MNRGITIFFLFLVLGVSAQHPDDPLKAGINKQYLEHLIKEGVDSVRLAHHLEPLANDSILYIASNYHSKYLQKEGKLNHKEPGVDGYETPQARAESFGAVNYGVGENIQMIPFGVPVKNRKKKTIETYRTYRQLANAFVIGWVNSKGHYANMITPEYQITGLSVAIDLANNMAYSTQKFANVYWKYEFPENKTMFPFSNYVTPEHPTSIKDLKLQLKRNKYPHKLKGPDQFSDAELKRIQKLIDISEDQSFLDVQRGNVYLKMYLDAHLFLSFLEGRKDGLALEVVAYNNYDCGNPEYYLNPSRRNGLSEITDTVLIPIYRKDLMKGFKPNRKSTLKRIKKQIKKNKKTSLYRNIRNGVSIPYSPDRFKVKLGKIPKRLEGYHEMNLVYIKKGSIVRVKHFTGICGEYYTEVNPLSLKLDSAIAKYEPVAKEKDYSFDFFFQKGKSEYNYKDLKPALDSLTDDEFIVTGIEINAYSSVEGKQEINDEIQKKRAESIVKAFASKSKLKVEPKIALHSSWKIFEAQIDSNPELDTLNTYSDQQLKDSLQSKTFTNDLEPFLQQQRFANVKIQTLFVLNERTLGRFVVKEYNRFQKQLKQFTEPFPQEYHTIIDSQLAIQYFVRRKIDERILTPAIFYEFDSPNLDHQHGLYNNLYVFQKEYDIDFGIKKSDIGVFADINNFYPTLAFNYLKEEVKNWDPTGLPNGFTLKDWDLYYTTMKYELPANTEEVEQLNINFLFKAAQYFFKKDDWNKKNEAASLIFDYYTQKGITEEHALRLAKGFIHFQAYPLATALLAPYYEISTNEELLAVYSKLTYFNSIEFGDTKYVDQLLKLRPRMSKESWCKMFVGPCNISFQVMDSEKMRDFYCSECAEVGNYGNSPSEWEETK